VQLAVVLDCADPVALAPFWAAAVGYRRVSGDGDPYVVLADPAGRLPELLLQRVAEPRTAKNRMHLDLRVDDLDGEVARLVAAGARPVGGRVHEDGWVWQVLADPEGNELCVLRPPGGPPVTR
jgi:predicted enzyme related to lactoylglutathione lyase